MSPRELWEAIKSQVGKVIIGQDEPLAQIFVGLLVNGHILLEGVPGVAKTLMAKAIARSLKLSFSRIQFTPDLMPSDVTGTMVYDPQGTTFRFKKGPIFAQIVLADEINRTPPKTQAALLEAMEERQVTVDGVPHLLPAPFYVLATLNPIEYEGTYPLPEAQLDRFLMKVIVGYPNEEEEKKVLLLTQRGWDVHRLLEKEVEPVADEDDLKRAQQEVEKVQVVEEIHEYLTTLVRRTRQLTSVRLGASPRAGLYWLKCAAAWAALQGRDFVIPDDIKAVAAPVLRHRLLLKPEAELEGLVPDAVVASLLDSVPVPR
ncbi:MAG: MoxR family ATPase [Armatimonadetes bacterium]|nr:MoxR family ATPase [Armatimonadota bacterium]MDW8121003.1 MoxR family ATPase [Armatimonadota bacterium]